MKDKAELMRRVRRERKEKGLVELREWLTLEQREEVRKYINSIKGR
jgi:hypothetical protein